MKEVLKDLLGKRVDIHCNGSAVFRGSVKSVEDGIIQISGDDDRVFFIDRNHIIAVSEVTDPTSRPGFLAN